MRSRFIVGVLAFAALTIALGVYQSRQPSGVDGWVREYGTLLATAVLVGITAWYAYLTRALLREARSSHRPVVVVDFEMTKPRQLQIIVSNIGDRPAEDIKFAFATDFVDRDGTKLSEIAALSNGIKYLAPGRGYRWRVFVDESVHEGTGKNLIDVTATYRYGEQVLNERTSIDLGVTDGMLFSSFRSPQHDMANSLQAIEHVLRSQDTQRRMQAMFRGPGRTPCPICGEPTMPGAKKCPHCGETIVDPEEELVPPEDAE